MTRRADHHRAPRPIPAPALDAASELAELFERDHELVLALNEAQGLCANGGLTRAGPDLGLSGQPPDDRLTRVEACA